MDLNRDHFELLCALNEQNVKYLVIGGYAVGVHSEPRSTKDLDVFIRTDRENAVAVFKALARFGAPLAGLSPNDFSDGKSFFQMGKPPLQIDVLQAIAGVEFDETWETRVYAKVNEALTVPVISAEMLVRNKLAAGRPRDILDAEDIIKAMQESKPRDPKREVPRLSRAVPAIPTERARSGMAKVHAATSASAQIDARIAELGDWRGIMLAHIRALIHAADPEILEEWKWRGVPVWSHSGIICTGETYKSAVKLTFAKGASLPDPASLFNSSLDGNVRRAIDLREGETVNERALRELIRAAIALNLASKSKPRRR